MRQRTKQDLDAAAKCLGRAANELAAAKASAQLGSVDEGDQAAWGTLGFDPGLNSHLAPPAPPRVIKVGCRVGGACMGGGWETWRSYKGGF